LLKLNWLPRNRPQRKKLSDWLR